MAEITFKILESKNELFKRLREEMRGLSNRNTFDLKGYHLFLIAAAIGYNWNQKLPLTGKTMDIGRASYLKEDERFLLHAIYYDGKEILDTPPSMSAALRLAEEYANAGLDILGDLLDKEQDFRELFIDLILEVHEA